MHHIGTTQVWHILVVALAGFAIGSLWYGPLFSMAWKKASGVPLGSMSTAQSVRLFVCAYLVNVIVAFGLEFLIGQPHSALFGAHTGFFVSLMFMAMAIGLTYLFEKRPLQLFLINAGYQVVNTTVMGAILGAWG
jgi:Protein of unknown function (DUF1761)